MSTGQRWPALAAAIIAGLVLAGMPSGASGASSAAACSRAFVGGKRQCLRAGAACRAKFERDYLLAGFQCARRTLRRASKAALRGKHIFVYDRNGHPSFPDALQAFDQQVARLPGVHTVPGAVGRSRSGTPLILALELYRNRLTAPQRAVLERVLRPHAAATVATPDLSRFAEYRDEALARLQAHGLRFSHAISLDYDPKDKNNAYTVAEWLDGTGNNCRVVLAPKGVNSNTPNQQDTIIHELIHCAEAEAEPSAAAWHSSPPWLIEGSATWGSAEIMRGWVGAEASFTLEAGDIWLKNSANPLFGRDYDATGFWALIDHEGPDPLTLIQPLIARSNGQWQAAFDGALAQAPDAAEEWGPTTATVPALGHKWDLSDEPSIRPRDPPEATIGEGDDWGQAVAARGGYAEQLDLEADVVTVSISPGSVQGTLRDSDGNEQPLRLQAYCTRDEADGGCKCPDGFDPGYPHLPKGKAYVGFADIDSSGAAYVAGHSIDEVCQKKGHLSPVCQLLVESGLTAAVPGGTLTALFNTCDYGRCLAHYQEGDPPQTKCDVAHGITLTLHRFGTRQQAQQGIAKFSVCPQVRIGADLAYQCTKPSGSTVVMAKGRTGAYLVMGASSDHEGAEPAWDVKRPALNGARRIAARLPR